MRKPNLVRNQEQQRGLPKLGGLVLTTVVLAMAGAGCGGDSEATAQTGAAARQVRVVLEPAELRTFSERLSVQGTVSAKHYAMVPARLGGTLEAYYVDEGDTVVEGQSRLFEVDSVKVEKALEIARQELAVATYARKEREAYLRQIEAENRKAMLDYDRYRRLFEEQAVSLDAYEQQETRLAQSQAMIEHARSLVDLAREQEQQARTAVGIAEKDRNDALTVAPISGVVSRRLIERGEMAESGRPVIRIDDPSVVEISAHLPAQYYQQIRPGGTQAEISIAGTGAGANPISYRSPTIDPVLRTFEIRCVVEDPAEGLVPGAMATVDIALTVREGIGVPTDAVQIRSGESVVFTVDDGLARMMRVTTGLQSNGWTELLDGSVPAGTPIVSMGQFQLNDGAPVTVQEGTR